MMDAARVIYSINIEDVQNVAEEHLGREASKKELKIVEDKLGNYIDWYEAITFALNDAVNLKKVKTKTEKG